MKAIFTALITFVFSHSIIGQTVGDLTLAHTFNHTLDPSSCQTIVNTSYSLIIENSFVGDQVTVNYFQGIPNLQQTNTTGASPWIISNFFQNETNFSDFMVTGNLLEENVNTFIYKVKVGTDSIINPIQYQGGPLFSLTIPNPCTYFTIQGNVYDDADASCTFTPGDSPYNNFQYIHFRAYPNMAVGFMQSGVANGFYSTNFLPQQLVDSMEVFLPSFYQFIFPQTGCVQTSYMLTAENHTGKDFILDCSSLSTDVVVDAFQAGAVRPFLNFGIQPMVGNLGCQLYSGVLKIVPDPNVSYNAGLSQNPADWVDGDTLFFNFTNLNNATGGGFWQSFLGQVNFTADGSLNIGDSVCFEIISSYPMADINPLNNQVTRCFPVVNSYDPNNKEVTPVGIGSEGFIAVNTQKLKYKINFQNTGNAPALKVVLIDTLDASKLIPSTLRILGTSHSMEPNWLSNNIIQFVYEDINLPDSTTDLLGSQGFVVFEIDMVQGLSEGDEIKNKAEIYFDTNEPIITNFALNTIEFGETNSLNELQSNGLAVYPNPTKSMVRVHSLEDIQSINVFSMNGQKMVGYYDLNTKEIEIDLSNFDSGVYIIEAMLHSNVSYTRIIKQ